jgi:hypothetical protein
MSGTFAGYVCWTRADVDDTINTEAVHADRAVFLATHRPLSIVRRTWDSSDRSEQVDEEAVLDDFLHRPPTGGVVLMPIRGESGTGKSHLVRWVKEALPADTPDRRVIYLRKTETNLAAVVNALLIDLDGPLFDDIRNRVSRNIGQYDPERLPHELLDRLALALQFSTPAEQPRDRLQANMHKMLTSERGLPALLRDYEYRRHLLRPDGVVVRFATELLRGRSSDEAERPAAFAPDDLKAEIGNAALGPVAYDCLRQLIASEPLLKEAARLLTEHLGTAVLRLTELDGGRLAAAMTDIRRAVYTRGQEIVLLIEDFALIQGIQRDLLDAISETGVREGRQEMATIRTLMAVTGGYFDNLPETLKTRAKASVPYVYDLDVPLGEGPVGVSDQQLVDFTARYLNAARSGRAALVRAYSEAGGGSEWIPNACTKCPFRPQCHDAFGVSSDGFGLYPYNESAIRQTVRVTSARNDDTFNPRNVLSRVVRVVLDNYDVALREGRFPPPAFHVDFPGSRLDRMLPPEVEARLLKLDPTDHERRVDVMNFWGGAPAAIVNLDSALHQAFGLPILAASAVEEVQVDPAPNTAPRAMAEPTPTSALQLKLSEVDAWHGRNELLPQDLANNVRSWLRDAVIARVPWSDLGLPTPTQAIRKAVLGDRLGNAVIIEGAFGEKGIKAPGKASIVLNKGPVTATLLKAVLERVERGNWNFAGGPAQQRLLFRRLDEWAASMVDAMREHLGLHQPATLTAAVEASLLGARLLDLEGSRTLSREDLLTALFAPGPAPEASSTTHRDVECRAPEWTKLAAHHMTVRTRLVTQLREVVGAAQGDGGEQLVDAALLLPAIDTLVSDWRPKSEPDGLPEWVATAYTSLRRGLDAAVGAQYARLQELSGEYRRLTGDADPEILLKELDGAIGTLALIAPRAGGRSPEEWLDDCRQARRYPWKKWQRLAVELAAGGVADSETSTGARTTREDEFLRRLRITVPDRGEQFYATLSFLRQCARWLDDALRLAERERSMQPADPRPELSEVLADAGRVLGTLAGGSA